MSCPRGLGAFAPNARLATDPSCPVPCRELPEGVECFPRPLMRWSEDFYRPVFSPFGDFLLRENGATPWCACKTSPECCTACSCGLHWRWVSRSERDLLVVV